MISSANRWAIWRAVSSLASLGVLLGEDLGNWVFLASSRKPLTTSLPPWTPMLPKATMAALAGAADHWREVDLSGDAGGGLRGEGLRDHVEDAGVGEVGVEDGVEGVSCRWRSPVGVGGLEVGGGEADARRRRRSRCGTSPARGGVDERRRMRGGRRGAGQDRADQRSYRKGSASVSPMGMMPEGW